MELFQKAGEQLAKIKGIKSFDLQKGQFNQASGELNQALPACLMEFRRMRYEDMSNQVQEAHAVVSFYLYMGCGEQGAETTAHETYGLIDELVEAIQWLKGEHFKPLSQSLQKSCGRKYGMPCYRLDFETWCYRRVNRRFVS